MKALLAVLALSLSLFLPSPTLAQMHGSVGGDWGIVNPGNPGDDWAIGHPPFPGDDWAIGHPIMPHPPLPPGRGPIDIIYDGPNTCLSAPGGMAKCVSEQVVGMVCTNLRANGRWRCTVPRDLIVDGTLTCEHRPRAMVKYLCRISRDRPIGGPIDFPRR